MQRKEIHRYYKYTIFAAIINMACLFVRRSADRRSDVIRNIPSECTRTVFNRIRYENIRWQGIYRWKGDGSIELLLAQPWSCYWRMQYAIRKLSYKLFPFVYQHVNSFYSNEISMIEHNELQKIRSSTCNKRPRCTISNSFYIVYSSKIVNWI